MPLKFWEVAFLTATHLINFTPSRLLDLSTLLAKLTNESLDYMSLRVFGCACWPNHRPCNTQKLEFRSKRCAFIGYSHPNAGSLLTNEILLLPPSLIPCADGSMHNRVINVPNVSNMLPEDSSVQTQQNFVENRSQIGASGALLH
jgi:hypothetical protein